TRFLKPPQWIDTCAANVRFRCRRSFGNRTLPAQPSIAAGGGTLIASNMSGSLRGHFLIASQRLRDPNFFRTAVLILEHNAQGAMGLIVNRPTPVSVADALEPHFSLEHCEAKVFQGGPVEPSALFIIHNDRLLDPQAR